MLSMAPKHRLELIIIAALVDISKTNMNTEHVAGKR